MRVKFFAVVYVLAVIGLLVSALTRYKDVNYAIGFTLTGAVLFAVLISGWCWLDARLAERARKRQQDDQSEPSNQK